MSVRTVTHLNFQGTARAALAFYHAIFNGQHTLVTYAQVGRAEESTDPDHVIWGQVTGDDGIALMACDVPAGLEFNPGHQPFYVSLRGDDADMITALWNGLADGAEILQAPAPSQWSPLYGMLRDRFGVTWVVDVMVPRSPT